MRRDHGRSETELKQAVKQAGNAPQLKCSGALTRAFVMRKVFLLTTALTVGGLMLHGAFACELNREAGKATSPIVLLGGICSGTNCLVNPPQDLLTSVADEKRTPVDQLQDCGAAYFDPGTYSGSNGRLDWLVALLDTQSQYEPGAGFAPSPMDANAQYQATVRPDFNWGKVPVKAMGDR